MDNNSPQNGNSFNAENLKNNNENIGIKFNLRLKNIIFAFLCFISVCLSAFALDIDPLGFYRDNKTGEGFYKIGKMVHPRDSSTIIKLPDNKFFIAGGYASGPLRTTEVFDYKTRKSIDGPLMKNECQYPLLFLLNDGKVLIKEVPTINSNKIILEIYNPATNSIETIKEILNSELGRSASLLKEILYISDSEVIICDCNYDLFILFNTKTKKVEIIKKSTKERKELRYIKTIEDDLFFFKDHVGLVKIRKGIFYKYIKNEISNETLNEIIKQNTYANKNLVKGAFLDWFPDFFYLENENRFEILADSHLIYFDLLTNTFEDKKVPIAPAIKRLGKTYKLRNNKIAIILPRTRKIQVFNTKTLEVENKLYDVPAWRGGKAQINDDSLIFVGGLNNFLKSSKNIYIWKGNKK